IAVVLSWLGQHDPYRNDCHPLTFGIDIAREHIRDSFNPTMENATAESQRTLRFDSGLKRGLYCLDQRIEHVTARSGGIDSIGVWAFGKLRIDDDGLLHLALRRY